MSFREEKTTDGNVVPISCTQALPAGNGGYCPSETTIIAVTPKFGPHQELLHLPNSTVPPPPPPPKERAIHIYSTVHYIHDVYMKYSVPGTHFGISSAVLRFFNASLRNVQFRNKLTHHKEQN